MGSTDFFKVEKKEHDIYMIDAPLRVKSYVVLGKEKAMVIDTTNGIGSLMEKVRQITDLPLIVVNTHGHPDHAGGNVEFEEVYLHPADDEVFRQMVTKEFRQADIEAIMQKDAPPMVDALLDFKEDYIPMEDGQVFDLGDRTLRVIHTPGHTKGCCCLLDEKTGLLFSGDSVSWAETWLYLDYSTDLKTYKASLEKLESMMNQVTGIIPAHTPEEVVPIPTEQITIIKDCVQAVMDGELVGEWFETFAGVGMLARKGKGAIVYRPDEVRNRE